MNVCHIITRLIVGGAQENTLLTCKGLHQHGHEVHLVIGPDAGPEGSLTAEAHAGGYGVHVAQHLRRAVRPLEDLRARREIRRLLERIRPDVVHTHSSKAGIVGRLAAHDAGVPAIVHTIHGASFNRTQTAPLRWFYRKLERRCGRITHRFISVADAMTRQMLDAGVGSPDRYTTIYSGMRTEWFDPARHDRAAIRSRWGFDDSMVVAGAIARLFRNKGYESLIPAMAQAARRCPELRFVWVGDGAQRGEYEQQLGALGLRDRVLLTGLVRPEEVAAMIAGMDFLVHASQWEGLPRAAVQALLMERPVISFDIDGAPEVVIPHQTGVLVPLNDQSRLAEAMVELAARPDLRRACGRAGRTLCLDRFDWKYMVDRIERVYRELLSEQHPTTTSIPQTAETADAQRPQR